MNIDRVIYDHYKKQAENVNIKNIVVGIGYTGVELENGMSGLCYTYFDKKTGCTMITENIDFEGKKAINLLEFIFSDIPVMKTLAIATVNAFNSLNKINIQEDSGLDMFDKYDFKKNTEVYMVGYFEPFVKILENRGCKVTYIDDGKGLGDQKDFFNNLKKNAEIILITSTSLINNSFEELINNCPDQAIKILVGPSTIMNPEIFSGYDIACLAGMMPVNTQSILKVLRIGGGTKDLKKYCKKVISFIK